MVLVMGQNPAQISHHGFPFVGTGSGKRLVKLLRKANVRFYKLDNLSKDKTVNNKPLKRSEMVRIAKSNEFKNRIEAYEKVLAIGRQAELALEIAKLHHKLPHLKVMYVPHTSGLNRIWNDPKKESQVVEMVNVFVNGGIKI